MGLIKHLTSPIQFYKEEAIAIANPQTFLVNAPGKNTAIVPILINGFDVTSYVSTRPTSSWTTVSPVLSRTRGLFRVMFYQIHITAGLSVTVRISAGGAMLYARVIASNIDDVGIYLESSKIWAGLWINTSNLNSDNYFGVPGIVVPSTSESTISAVEPIFDSANKPILSYRPDAQPDVVVKVGSPNNTLSFNVARTLANFIKNSRSQVSSINNSDCSENPTALKTVELAPYGQFIFSTDDMGGYWFEFLARQSLITTPII